MSGSLKRRKIVASSVGLGPPLNVDLLPEVDAPDPEPLLPECDRELGLYLRAYNEIEKGMLSTFERLLDSNPTAAQIIFHSSASAATIREIMTSIGRNRLNKKAFDKLDKLLSRVKTQATFRNRIVHGTWMMVIKVHRHKNGTEVKRTNKWVRWYQPSDPEMVRKMMGPRKNTKLLADYQFEISRLNQLAAAAFDLGREIQVFSECIKLEPYNEAQPIGRI